MLPHRCRCLRTRQHTMTCWTQQFQKWRSQRGAPTTIYPYLSNWFWSAAWLLQYQWWLKCQCWHNLWTIVSRCTLRSDNIVAICSKHWHTQIAIYMSVWHLYGFNKRVFFQHFCIKEPLPHSRSQTSWEVGPISHFQTLWWPDLWGWCECGLEICLVFCGVESGNFCQGDLRYIDLGWICKQSGGDKTERTLRIKNML